MLMEKRCGHCKTLKPLLDFGSNKTRSDGLQPRCRDCTRIIQAEWYVRNRDSHVTKVVKQKKERVALLRSRVRVYLVEHPCVVCGDDELLMLDFDHVRGVKRETISVMVTACFSWEVITQEIAKCEVRCVRCHRRKTAAQLGWHQP